MISPVNHKRLACRIVDLKLGSFGNEKRAHSTETEYNLALKFVRALSSDCCALWINRHTDKVRTYTWDCWDLRRGRDKSIHFLMTSARVKKIKRWCSSSGWVRNITNFFLLWLFYALLMLTLTVRNAVVKKDERVHQCGFYTGKKRHKTYYRQSVYKGFHEKADDEMRKK